VRLGEEIKKEEEEEERRNSMKILWSALLHRATIKTYRKHYRIVPRRLSNGVIGEKLRRSS